MGLFGISFGPKLVIVEDDLALSEIYKTRMEILGYKCFAAYDGETALQIIQQEKPNLVLLDLMIPKIAGDQILATMRASEWGKKIKVLIISNLNESDAPAGLREMGIEGYAVKANMSDDTLDRLVYDIVKPPIAGTTPVAEAPATPADLPTMPPAPSPQASVAPPTPVVTPPAPSTLLQVPVAVESTPVPGAPTPVATPPSDPPTPTPAPQPDPTPPPPPTSTPLTMAPDDDFTPPSAGQIINPQ